MSPGGVRKRTEPLQANRITAWSRCPCWIWKSESWQRVLSFVVGDRAARHQATSVWPSRPTPERPTSRGCLSAKLLVFIRISIGIIPCRIELSALNQLVRYGVNAPLCDNDIAELVFKATRV